MRKKLKLPLKKLALQVEVYCLYKKELQKNWEGMQANVCV